MSRKSQKHSRESTYTYVCYKIVSKYEIIFSSYPLHTVDGKHLDVFCNAMITSLVFYTLARIKILSFMNSQNLAFTFYRNLQQMY